MKESSSDPWLAIIIVPDHAAAIRVANDTKYGLGGSVYTRDTAPGRQVAEQIEAGMVFINHRAGSPKTCPLAASKNPVTDGRPGPLGI